MTTTPTTRERASDALLLVLALLLLHPDRADACSCAEAGPPCQAFWKVDAVFTGVVTEIAEAPRSSAMDDIGGNRLVTFLVEERFRGVDAGWIQVRTGSRGGDCGFRFAVGERYIVYASRTRDREHLTTSTCRRTKHFSEANDDIVYARAVTEPSKPATLIFGNVTLDDNGEATPMASLPVRALGDGRFETRTDREGNYRFSNLPPATYVVAVDLPENGNFAANPLASVATTLNANGCIKNDFIATFKPAEIEGRVTTASGQPAHNVTVHIAWSTPDENGRFHTFRHAVTSRDGTYAFVGIARGSYFVGLNIADPPNLYSPYAPTFYPGGGIESAAPIVVRPGESLKHIDFGLPSRLQPTTVRGRVVGETGMPLENVPVWLIDSANTYHPAFMARTTSNGSFDSSGFEGGTYELHALARSRSTRCLRATSQRVVVTASLEEIKLVADVPDPNCSLPWER
jgi:hypothetical protein